MAAVAEVAAVAANQRLETVGKLATKGKKPKLPNNVCCRYGKPQHQKKKYCKALEVVCRGCGAKGHYEKVCMRKAMHLVGIQDDSDPE